MLSPTVTIRIIIVSLPTLPLRGHGRGRGCGRGRSRSRGRGCGCGRHRHLTRGGGREHFLFPPLVYCNWILLFLLAKDLDRSHTLVL